MKINYEYLNDYTFLKQLAKFPVKDYFAKISLLNWQEEFIQDIEGKIVSGNINIDGNSSLRRTANLTMHIKEDEANQITKAKNIISINKKIYLMVGFKNPTQKYLKYDTIWFPLGLYVITNCSLSSNLDGNNLSIQLKDKMVLLNGECGGTLPATTILDTYETIDENGNTTISKPTIYQIIKELVNHFGKQQLGKIIISDIDDKVKQVMKWTGDVPLYILEKRKYIQKTENDNIIYEENQNGDYIKEIVNDKAVYIKRKRKQIFITSNASIYNKHMQRDDCFETEGSPFSYNQDVGFILTDFTYPGELIAAPGQTVVDMLEKIKTILGNYEYFYDINGNFIFQEIKNFVNISESTYALQQSLKTLQEGYTYTFNGSGRKKAIELESDIIFSYNNNPQYGIIRNDFIIWGARKNGQKKQLPIRYHIAIDKKPKIGNTYKKIFKYHDDLENQDKWGMAKSIEDSQLPVTGQVNDFYQKKDGKIYGWKWDGEKYTWEVISSKTIEITTKDWRTQLLFQGMQDMIDGKTPNDYYAELIVEWPKIYDIEKGKFYDNVKNNPGSINYFLDFIDTPQLNELNVENIGRRSFVKDYGNKINCIFQPYIPQIAYIGINSLNQSSTIEVTETDCELMGLDYYRVPNSIYDGLQIGGVLNSAYEEIKQQLNYYTNYNNTISIQTLPLFFLQPNTLITLNSKEANLAGDFLIKSMSFSLDHASQLNINAIKNVVK